MLKPTGAGATSVGIPDFGAFVISLDFELHWGVRDWVSKESAYWQKNLLGVREAIPRMLQVFDEFQVAATWATVGLLFAASRDERERFLPAIKPAYPNPALSADVVPVGVDESDDPAHYAAGLIRQIHQTPRQEIASHTFSHYYCMEAGQDRQTFEADLQSAIAIAEKDGIRLESIVFPRNQHNPVYEDLLLKYGFRSYRGNQNAWMYRAATDSETNLLKRGGRLLNTYMNVAGFQTTRWEDVRQESGICNIPASLFLKPYAPGWKYLERLHRRRIAESLRRAALSKEIFHLWWHPHNFGAYLDENIRFLRTVLQIFANYREQWELRSLSMREVASLVAEGGG